MKKIVLFFYIIIQLFHSNHIIAQWNSVEIGIKNKLTDVYFINDTLGFCIGDSSILFFTENSGKTWHLKHLDDTKRRLNEISFFNETGFIVGDGAIYRTTDKGIDWLPVVVDSLANFAGLDFYAPNKIWVYGGINNLENRGVIYESVNLGETWYKKFDTEQHFTLKGKRIHAVKLISETNALILCTGSIDPLGPTYIYRTTNNGIDWNYYSENIHYTWGLSSIDTDTLWSWGIGLELSVDSGETWSSNEFLFIKEDGSLENFTAETIIDLEISENSRVNFLQAKDDQYSVLINKENPLVWERIDIPTTTRLTSMYFIDCDNIWCTSLSGSLITNSKIISSVKDYSDLDINSNFIVLGNYPNPFNATTRIKYHVKNSTSLTLSLYDLAGQRINIFRNNYHSAGDYHHDIDSHRMNLSSGVYIYSLTDSHIMYSRKILLIK